MRHTPVTIAANLLMCVPMASDAQYAMIIWPDGSMSLRVKHLSGCRVLQSGFASGRIVNGIKMAFMSIAGAYTSVTTRRIFDVNRDAAPKPPAKT